MDKTIENIEIEKINDILPQTQCTRCGYPSCRDYAVAIANQQANINQCPPGGDEGILKLSVLTGRLPTPLNPNNGIIKNKTLAYIQEDQCIGCFLCVPACPVDAIIGARKMLHTVLADECTGCDLCIPACPVDCIEIIDDPNQDWNTQRQQLAKNRFEQRNNRILK